jgi:hypothetical protein
MDKDELEQPAKAAAIATLAILKMNRTRHIDPLPSLREPKPDGCGGKGRAVEGWFRIRMFRFASAPHAIVRVNQKSLAIVIAYRDVGAMVGEPQAGARRVKINQRLPAITAAMATGNSA